VINNWTATQITVLLDRICIPAKLTQKPLISLKIPLSLPLGSLRESKSTSAIDFFDWIYRIGSDLSNCVQNIALTDKK